MRATCLLLAGVAASELVLSASVMAADFTIFNGEIITATQTLDTPGDVGTVQQGGIIDVPAGHGIEAIVNEVTVKNSGSVSGDTANGISILDDSTIENSGTASGGFAGIAASNANTIGNSGTASGDMAGIIVGDDNAITNSGTTEAYYFGIVAYNNNAIVNSGTARGTSAAGAGILAYDNNTILNSGTAESGLLGIYIYNGNTLDNSGLAKGGAVGVYAIYDNNTITNSGTATGGETGIRVRDSNSATNSGTVTGGIHGIEARDFNTITNSGTASGQAVIGINAFYNNTITNSGTASGEWDGINALSNNTIANTGMATGATFGIGVWDNNTITNSGTVSGGSIGIYAGNYNAIRNSGRIVGGTNAVVFTELNNTLTLLAGSNIQGILYLGDASNELTIGPGLNTALAFTGGTIVDTGLPFIVDAGVVYAVDVTGFSVQDDLASDLTRAVADGVDSRLSGLRGANGGLSTAMNGLTITATSADPSSGGLWLAGLGAYRDQKVGDSTIGFNSLLGGAMLGLDGMVGADTRAGLFAGWATADLETDTDSQDLASDSFFGGVYGSHGMGQAFVDASVTVG